MDACVLPSLTYACQTWSLTEQNAKRVQVCQRTMERSLLGIKLIDKQRNTDIREQTKLRDAIEHMRRLKWRWAGHIARYKDGRWTRSTTTWLGPRIGKRRPGRPLKRSVDDVRAVATG